MIKHSIICCIYNSMPVVRRCLTNLLACELGGSEIILVDNHSPDEDARRYIRVLAAQHDNLSVVDPGKNLGCHRGWNFGYEKSCGQSEFVYKLDDDTEVKTPAFLPLMAYALNMVPDLGFVSADIDAKQANKYEKKTLNSVTLEIALNGVVGFSLVGFRRADIQRWGLMQTGVYRAAGGRVFENEDRLYGGEEVFYATAARGEGRIIAHLPSVFAHHLDNQERDPDYAMWKRAYGFHGWTDLDLVEWRNSGQFVTHYRRSLALELHSKAPNEALLLEWVTRLGQIGGSEDTGLIDATASMTSNGVVRDACKAASAKLGGAK